MTGEEAIIRQPSGREIHVLTNAAPVRDKRDRITGAVVVFEDITRLKELERQREEWTSLVAHDLRQPVTVIDGYAKLLARRAEQYPSEVRARVEHILNSATQLNRMVADLLDVSRIEARRLALELQPVDLPALVHGAVERTMAAVDGHPVRIEVAGDIPSLEVDPLRIEQILGNLLSNATKYGYPHTEILVKIARTDGEVAVSIINQGEGISPDELSKLFARFCRTGETGAGRVQGIGLGLYISKGLVEAHGGHIWVESTPGKTTTFTFTLPVFPPGPSITRG